MDESLKSFLTELRARLSGFPESETREAVEYYEEYINDALEEGENAENILSHLDSPERIAAVIMTETSIRKAQSKPGLKNYSNVLKYSRTLITKPLSVLLFSIFVIVTYSTAFLLFLGAIVSAAAACIVLPGAVYEALKIPAGFTAEIIGTIGGGLFFAALCLLPAYGLFKLCTLFIRLSASLVGRILNKPGNQLRDTRQNSTIGISSPSPDSEGITDAGEKGEKIAKRAGTSRWIPWTCLIAITVGLILSLSTGLPVKLFMIFNSTESSSITTQEWEYSKSDVNKISITTAHSHIRLEKGSSDKIKILYEQPDWMEPEISCANGQLTFEEKSNGRLPLFFLVSLHENRTDVVVTLPAGFEPAELKLESRGGFIYIETGDFNTKVKTYTGSIYVEKGTAMTAGVKAGTSTGIIQAAGKDAGTKTAGGIKYEAVVNGGKAIEIETSRGSIFIDWISSRGA